MTTRALLELAEDDVLEMLSLLETSDLGRLNLDSGRDTSDDSSMITKGCSMPEGYFLKLSDLRGRDIHLAMAKFVGTEQDAVKA